MAPDDRISQPAQREVMDGWMDGMVVSRSAVTGAEGLTTKRPADRDGLADHHRPVPVADFDESLDQSKSKDEE